MPPDHPSLLCAYGTHLHLCPPRFGNSQFPPAFSVCSPVEGTPNCTKHPARNALATVSAVISVIGNAFGQRVKQSTHVSKYVKPFEGGKGPTIARWI